MVLKKIAIAAAIAMALAICWRYRHAEVIQDIINPQAVKAVKIEFDNGTVRQYQAASQAGGNTASAKPPGAMRKCLKGAETSYTNNTCPPGAKELEIANGTVTVVGSAGPAAARNPPKSLAPAPDPAEPSIRQMRVERIVGN